MKLNQQKSLIVLCGGQARRLGTDKGLFRALGYESLVVRALRRFRHASDDLMIGVRDQDQAALYLKTINEEAPELAGSFRIVTDTPEELAFQGALRGVVSGLLHAKHDDLIALPVDQVAVSSRHVKILNKQLGTTYFSADNDEIWPFPSQWSKLDQERLFARLHAGAYSVKGALAALVANPVRYPAFDHAFCINTNTHQDMQDFFGTPVFDPFQRRMNYLRFSLIESCNMSCHYCLPEGFPEWYRHKARLSKNEIAVLLAGFRRLGFRKVRFTGGEPTLHPNCLEAVEEANKIGYEEICLTTNGTRIKNIRRYIDAGLSALNISIDSLNPDTFKRLTKSDQLADILRLVDDAIAEGLHVKINTVLLRSQNGADIASMIDWALAKPLTLRFIELMPTKLNQSFDKLERVHGYEIEPLLLERGLTDVLRPEDKRGQEARGPATVYSSPRFPGKIGLINPMSCNFCSACNRLRVGARGGVRLCLFAEKDLTIPTDSPEAVETFMRQLISTKGERHQLEDGRIGNVSTFRTIGG